MIKSIKLRNWRSHADTVLEFKEGTNLLMGLMGAGKSSILDAISFALFNTFPALERRKMKLQDIFRLSEDKAQVALEMIWNGSAYTIERDLIRGKAKVDTDAKFFRDGSLLESGTTAVSDYVSSLLGIDYDLFTRAIYSEQNNIDYFLTLGPGKRKEEMDILLGLDKFEVARSNIVSVINRLKNEREIFEGKFNPEALESAKRKCSEQEKELAAFQQRLKEISTLSKAIEESHSKTRALSSELEKKRELHTSLLKDRIKLETLISQFRSDLGSGLPPLPLNEIRTSLSGKQKESTVLREELKGSENVISSYVREAGALEESLKQAKKAALELERARKELDDLLRSESLEGIAASIKESEEGIIADHSEIKSMKALIEETNDLMRKINPEASDCPLCGNKLGDKGIKHIIEEKNKKLRDLGDRINLLDKQDKSKQSILSELRNRLKKAESLQSTVARLSRDIVDFGKLENSIRNIQEKNAKEKEKKESIERLLNSLAIEIQALSIEVRKSEDMEKKQNELAKAQDALYGVSKKLAELGFDEKTYDGCRAELERLTIDKERLSGERVSMEKQASMAQDILKAMGKEIDALGSMEKEIARHRSIESQLSIYKNALLETQTSLRSDLCEAINSAMKEVWKIFYPYGNYTSVRLLVSEKDYSLEVMERDSWKPLESIASGGERACAALALRVALATVLTPNLSWLILDEPTHNLDAEAVSLLSETLQSRVPEVVKQTFVITHEEGLMGADFSSSYRLARNKSESGPTSVERI